MDTRIMSYYKGLMEAMPSLRDSAIIENFQVQKSTL